MDGRVQAWLYPSPRRSRRNLPVSEGTPVGSRIWPPQGPLTQHGRRAFIAASEDMWQSASVPLGQTRPQFSERSNMWCRYAMSRATWYGPRQLGPISARAQRLAKQVVGARLVCLDTVGDERHDHTGQRR